MANEFSLTAKLTATKNSVSVTQSVSTKTQSMETTAGIEYLHHTVQAVSTSEEAVSTGDVDITNATGQDYFLLLYNRGTTASSYVTVRIKITAGPTYIDAGRMYPGEPFGPIRAKKLDGSSLGGYYLVSSSGTQDVEVTVAEAGDPNV